MYVAMRVKTFVKLLSRFYNGLIQLFACSLCCYVIKSAKKEKPLIQQLILLFSS